MIVDWKHKLLAFLHDPPSKVLDLSRHGEQSGAAMIRAGFTEEEIRDYNRPADHTAAAADRFPFPGSQSSGMRCHFDGVRAGFHHPLNGTARLKFHRELKDVAGIEGEGDIQPVIARWPEDWDENTLWRARFFAHWRLWPRFAVDHDYRFGFLPADTRMPDHTIWNHMQIVSALATCASAKGKGASLAPAFLKFQLGPVQAFIAQARSTRDLWSGSYLLSWLMAAGLKRLSELVGPDAVIYPSLRDQPLFDLHWKAELWDEVFIGDRPVWESIRPGDDSDLLTPNLPNVCLALVPAEGAPDLARELEETVRAEFRRIAESVWQACERVGLPGGGDEAFKGVDRKERFEKQIDRFLSLSWRITSWPETVDEALSITNPVPLSEDDSKSTLRDRVRVLIEAATRDMPVDHRDPRYYTDKSKTRLNNVGIAWALLTALNSWELDAVRQTRAFRAWSDGGWEVGASRNKDSLTGLEEAVAGGRVWLEKCNELAGRSEGSSWNKDHGALANRFKHDDWVGGITLLKRLWDLTYLKPVFGLEPLRMPNTHGLARHDPFSDDDEPGAPPVETAQGERYFAVLAFDGDEIGKWLAGDKCPPFRTQLADYEDGSGNPQGALEYFTRDSDPDGGGTLKDRFRNLLETRRPVSPSYHLQFSEALSNFALRCARPIVESFLGRLIYAGGDDVVALLPADTALDCAQVLRRAFQGGEVVTGGGAVLFSSPSPGFLSSENRKDDHGKGMPIPFLVPGPAADCSVGIAIAHFKSPLQDVVREAQRAGKRAKDELDRSAVAVTLLKRSGETVEWGCKWDGGGLEACASIIEALQDGVVSAKFPHRILELVEGYSRDEGGAIEEVDDFVDVVDGILTREIAVAADRQRGKNYSLRKISDIQKKIDRYLKSIPSPERKVQGLIGLCRTVAFIERNISGATGDDDSGSPDAPTTEPSTPQTADRQPAS